MATSARRRERRQRPGGAGPAAYPPIRHFADAVGTAFAIHARFNRARACFVIGRGGRVEQGWALTGPEHDESHVLTLALLVPDRELTGRSLRFTTDPTAVDTWEV